MIIFTSPIKGKLIFRLCGEGVSHFENCSSATTVKFSAETFKKSPKSSIGEVVPFVNSIFCVTTFTN